MKSFIPMAKNLSILLSLVFFATMFSNDANAQGVFEKRKHRKGFYINISKSNKKAKAVTSEELSSTRSTQKAVIDKETIQALPFAENKVEVESASIIENEEAVANVEVDFTDEESTANNSELSETESNKNYTSSLKKEAKKGNHLSTFKQIKQLTKKQSPDGVSESNGLALDALLKKAIIWFAAGLAISVVASIISWVVGLWILYFLFWLAAAACYILALYFFIMWLMEQ